MSDEKAQALTSSLLGRDGLAGCAGCARTMATSTLEHLLAHHLAQNDAVPAALADVLDTLVSQLVVARCEGEEGLNGPLLHRCVAH